MPIELPILFKPEDDIDREALGIPDIDDKDLIVKYVTFLNINAIMPYKSQDGTECSMVLSNGETFICKIPYSQFNKIFTITRIIL